MKSLVHAGHESCRAAVGAAAVDAVFDLLHDLGLVDCGASLACRGDVRDHAVAVAGRGVSVGDLTEKVVDGSDLLEEAALLGEKARAKFSWKVARDHLCAQSAM